MVHSDVCHINITSPAGARYILNFIDYFSRVTWVYFLKSTKIVFENFKEFRDFVERQCGQPIKCLRSNNGGEYVNLCFKKYLVISGIE
jgi:hypothetical protein